MAGKDSDNRDVTERQLEDAFSRFGKIIDAQHQFSSPSSSINKKKSTSSCDLCRGKGFYMCKLCKGNATIQWSPLYDPVFINPCLCPTCDGHRIQRCLNCLGEWIHSTS